MCKWQDIWPLTCCFTYPWGATFPRLGLWLSLYNTCEELWYYSSDLAAILQQTVGHFPHQSKPPATKHHLNVLASKTRPQLCRAKMQHQAAMAYDTCNKFPLQNQSDRESIISRGKAPLKMTTSRAQHWVPHVRSAFSLIILGNQECASALQDYRVGHIPRTANLL